MESQLAQRALLFEPATVCKSVSRRKLQLDELWACLKLGVNMCHIRQPEVEFEFIHFYGTSSLPLCHIFPNE